MKKIHYNKLVRDRIPEIIKADGGNPKTAILNNKDYRRALLKKAVEETDELYQAKNKKEMIKEIGDVYEVIEAIVENFDLDKKEMIKLKNKRRRERGGFKRRTFLKYVEK